MRHRQAGEKAKELRVALGYSVESLARLAELPTGDITQAEQGQFISRSSLFRIARALQVDPSVFLALMGQAPSAAITWDDRGLIPEMAAQIHRMTLLDRETQGELCEFVTAWMDALLTLRPNDWRTYDKRPREDRQGGGPEPDGEGEPEHVGPKGASRHADSGD